jgi:chromosomal replication initiation ATPase DnaA
VDYILRWLQPQHSQQKEIHDLVVREVGYEFKIRSREKKYVRSRQTAMWLMQQQGAGSVAKIGRFYGLHHTTVMYALKIVERDRKTRPECLAATDHLLSLLRAPGSIPASKSYGEESQSRLAAS